MNGNLPRDFVRSTQQYAFNQSTSINELTPFSLFLKGFVLFILYIYPLVATNKNKIIQSITQIIARLSFIT